MSTENKKINFISVLLQSHFPGSTLILAATAITLLEGFDGGWVLDVPHVLLYITVSIAVTVYLMEVRTQSLLREKEREIKKLREEKEEQDLELCYLRADVWFLDGYLLPYLMSAVGNRRDLAKGCGLNTVLRVVCRMIEKIELSLHCGDLARFDGNAGDFFKELREELDRVAPPRRY